MAWGLTARVQSQAFGGYAQLSVYSKSNPHTPTLSPLRKEREQNSRWREVTARLPASQGKGALTPALGGFGGGGGYNFSADLANNC